MKAPMPVGSQDVTPLFDGGPTRIGVKDSAASSQKITPRGAWAATVVYDPDKGCRAEDFVVSSPTYANRFIVPTGDAKESWSVSVPSEAGPFKPTDVEGTFLVPVTESARFKPIKIKNKGDLSQLYESQKYNGPAKLAIDSGAMGFREAMRLREAFKEDDAGFFDGISSATQSPTSLIDRDEFVPIMAGPFYKQLYIYDYLLMHARAFQLVNHNALVAGAVKIMTRFALGRGLSFHVKNDKANAIWSEFWERNAMRQRARQIARDISWQGEMMLRYSEPSSGYTALRVLDASTCWEIVTDPEDIEHVYYYHFQYPTPYQIWVSGQIPTSKYVVIQIPPTNIQHVKINVSAQEKRGRSDLLPAMAWLKRFDDYYNGVTIKAVLEANLVNKIIVKGDQADVDAVAADPRLTILPPPGSTWVENEAMTLTPVTAQLTSGSRGSQGIGQQIAAIIATSLNLPAEYFNIEQQAGGAAKATALVRTDPATKAIEDRQQVLRETFEEMYDRVMSVAYDAGRLSDSDIRGEPDLSMDQEPEPARARAVVLR